MSEAAHPTPAPEQPPVHWRLLPDERLARRAAEGDSRALEEIYRRYHQDLYRFCLATTGRPQDAQDALQNTIVKVLRALPGEQREIELKPWLYRIARNESVEVLRRRRDNAELEPDQAVDAGIAEKAETRERLRILLADLDRLSERQRAALVLRELSGLDFAEIGAVFETSAAVARQTLYEARLSLRKLEGGREMHCADVMRELSDCDGRVTRRRELQAHLRGCADCRAFRDEISKRHEDLAALAPLPVAASAALLHGALGKEAGAAAGAAFGGGAGGGAVGAGGGGLTGGLGAGAGKAIATSALAKTAATLAVVAVAGVSALDRSGVVNLLPGGKHGGEAAKSGAPPHGAGGDAGAAAAEGAGRADEPRGPHSVDRDSTSSRAGSAKEDAQRAAAARRLGRPAGSPSRSDSGQAPPGGGHGRSAAANRGRPEQPPPASKRGRGTARGHKAPRATSPAASGPPPVREKPAAPAAGSPAPRAPAEGRPPETRAPAAEPPATTPESSVSPSGEPSDRANTPES